MSDRNKRKGEGGQNKGQKSKASALVEAEPDNPEAMEPSIVEEADRAVAARQMERTVQEGHQESMSHTAGVSDEGSVRDAITIEADGFKLVIGSDVGEETLRVMEQRRELCFERHTLPSRFWEPDPDVEDLKRLEEEYRENIEDDQELPFV